MVFSPCWQEFPEFSAFCPGSPENAGRKDSGFDARRSAPVQHSLLDVDAAEDDEHEEDHKEDENEEDEDEDDEDENEDEDEFEDNKR